MANGKRKIGEEEIVKRNVDLHTAFMRYILEQPAILDQLPRDFRLVILPDNDPALRDYNLQLLDQHPPEGKPVVFVRMRVGKRINFKRQRPTVYLPLAA